MNLPPHFRACVASLLTFALSCCATTSHDPDIAAARQGVVSSKKTYLQGALIGAAVGAGAGAVIGNQSHDRRGKEKGAVAGAIIGTIGGLMWAQHVVNQRQYYSNTSAYLNDCTRVAEAKRSSVEKYNKTLVSKTAKVRKDDALVRGTLKDSNAVLTSLRKEIELQEVALTNAKAERASTQQVQRHQNRIAALKAEERRLVAQMERLSDYPQQDAVTGSGGR